MCGRHSQAGSGVKRPSEGRGGTLREESMCAAASQMIGIAEAWAVVWWGEQRARAGGQCLRVSARERRGLARTHREYILVGRQPGTPLLLQDGCRWTEVPRSIDES